MKQLLLHNILSYYGQAEVTGPLSNPVLLTLIRKHAHQATDDSAVAWCGIFMGEMFDQIGAGKYKPEKYLSAKQWATIGKEIPIGEAKTGRAIVIFHRGNPIDWQGHVGLYVAHNAQNCFVASGNQNNSVNISPYSLNRLFKVVDISAILDEVERAGK